MFLLLFVRSFNFKLFKANVDVLGLNTRMCQNRLSKACSDSDIGHTLPI